MPNPVQHSKPLPPLPAKAYRHKTPARLFDSMDERRALGESYEPERVEPQEAYAIKIDVPGCTCAERSQQQLDECDVCEACVRYFDLDGPARGVNNAALFERVKELSESVEWNEAQSGERPTGLPIGASAPDKEGSAREPSCDVIATKARESTGQRALSKPDKHARCTAGSSDGDVIVWTLRGPRGVDPCIAWLVEALNRKLNGGTR